MTDVVDGATRSLMMSGIRSSNTRPEALIRSLLHRRGFRLRINVRNLPGKLDIVLPKYRAVIFVHGCFWHGHDCRLFRLPATRREFLSEKIAKNRANDSRVVEELKVAGWRVCVVWECSIRGASNDRGAVADKICDWLLSDKSCMEIRDE